VISFTTVNEYATPVRYEKSQSTHLENMVT